jgi:flagellar hook-associated protein 1 FlgK
VVARADQLALTFRQAANDLAATRVDANGRISDAVAQVNTRIKQIADLNANIVQADLAGKDANSMIDQRDQLVREVASYLPVTVLQGPNQSVTLMLAGSKTLVSADGTVTRLNATADPTSGDVSIYTTAAGAQEDVSNLITSGTIGGYINARDGALQEAQTGLDQLATELINSYNAVHSSGVGLDGNDGRNLFEPATALGAASNFRVSTDVADHPEYLAAAQESSALPGDNRNALALQALQESKFALASTVTAQNGILALAASGGSAVALAEGDLQHANAVTDQLVNLRESVSGVSTDEEMIALSRYQRAYQASVRVVDIANELLDELMSMAR